MIITYINKTYLFIYYKSDNLRISLFKNNKILYTKYRIQNLLIVFINFFFKKR